MDRTPAPISRVELFEDRVSVLRKVDIPSTPGRYSLSIGPLTPLLTERGLSFVGEEAVIVEESAIERQRITQRQADSEATQQLAGRYEAALDQHQTLQGAFNRAREREQRAQRAVEAAQEATPAVLLYQEEIADWVKALRGIHDELHQAHLEVLHQQEALRRHGEETTLLQGQLEQLRQGTTVEQVFLTFRIWLGGPAEIFVRYTIPCGLWRPTHRASLLGKLVTWEVGAMVWNTTGENWDDVELVCSTARPGDHANPPTLDDDQVYTMAREKEVFVEAREEEVHLAREGDAKRVDEPLGVDDGGEVRTFTAPDRVSVPTGGRPLFVSLESWEVEVEAEWRCYPERSSQVALQTRQLNAGTRPILAGPVDLLSENGVVGRGEVGLVPPGEPFTLGWGSHDGLWVARREDHRVERSRLTGHQRHQFNIELRISHVGDQPAAFRIRERLPVSELPQVKIPAPSATPQLDMGPDRDGFCDWLVQLEPNSQQTLKLSYSIEAPSSVVLPF